MGSKIQSMSLTWQLKKFDELTVAELYRILQLRNEVFVVEQNCVYQDADDKDTGAYHLMGWKNDALVAYTRIIPPGNDYAEPVIGRVVTSPGDRGRGTGKQLMEESIRQVYLLFGNRPIRIGAQVYLRKFYMDLGFIADGDSYLEDGIEHIQMIKP
jgi:ElaA protein